VWTAEGNPALLDDEGAEIVIVGHGDCSTGSHRRNHGEPEMVE
jgi:hypothetical protein